MSRPDITPAQIVALAGSLLALLAAFGLPLTTAQSAAIMQLVQILPPVLLASDAAIRVGRNVADARRSAPVIPIRVNEPAGVTSVTKPRG